MAELLKSLAEELRVPVVLFFELKESEETKGRPPLIRDLAESGLLEHADVVMLLRRSSHSDVVDIEIAKHPLALPETAQVAIDSIISAAR
jgi:replicative DNA helicase